jgi:hypothetical protein
VRLGHRRPPSAHDCCATAIPAPIVSSRIFEQRGSRG